MDWMWFITRAVFVAGGIAGTGVALLYLLQEKLIYVPKIPGVPNVLEPGPARYGLHHEEVNLETRDGTNLHAWLLHPRSWSPGVIKRRPTVLFFQENAGNMAHRLPYLRILTHMLNCSVFAPSYRGYGLSEGRPNEAGLKQDADASVDYLLQRPDINHKQLVVLGKSLGGAVGIYTVANNPDKFRAAIIENTFTSIEDVAPRVIPLLKYLIGPGRPGNWLIRNKWRSIDLIDRLRGRPLLLMSSLEDELLPPIMMRQLYERVTSEGAESCTWVEFENAGHMDAYEVAKEEYWPALTEFFEEHGLGPRRGEDGGEQSDEAEEQPQDAAAPGLSQRPGARAVRGAMQGATPAAEVQEGVRAQHHDSGGNGKQN